MDAKKTSITNNPNDKLSKIVLKSGSVFIVDDGSDKPIRSTRGNKNVVDDNYWKAEVKADDQCYFLKLEGDLKFEDVVGPHSLDNVTRKEFLVRLKDVFGFFCEEDKRIKRIQKASGATIAFISSPEVNFHLQARMELWGSADQVEIAELAIVREITKLYKNPFVPTILMQAPIYHNEVYVPVGQAIKLLGVTFENIVKVEAESGAWLVVDPLGIKSPLLPMRRVNIFGSRDQVYRALLIVNKAVMNLEPYKLVDTEPLGTVQAADERKDVVLDHQLSVDSSHFIKGSEEAGVCTRTDAFIFLFFAFVMICCADGDADAAG